MRSFYTKTFLKEIADILNDGHQTVIPVSGTSMEPCLIDQKDRVKLEKLNEGTGDTTDIKKGDILLYLRNGDQYVLHRVVYQKGLTLQMRGDNQLVKESVPVSSVCARVIEIEHSGKWYSCDSAYFKFYSLVWNRLPILRWIRWHLIVYGKRLKSRKRTSRR